METQNKSYNQGSVNPNHPVKERSTTNISGRVFGGLIIVAVGVALLARKMGLDVPYWLFRWPMIMIVIGLYVGVKHSFKGFSWLIPMVIGFVFLADDLFWDLPLKQYFWPIAIIAFGLFMILRPKRNRREDFYPITENSTDDSIDSVTIFGGVKKNVISKTFRGGEAVTIFGGTELNLMQADVETPITLELVQIFGGTKLIVPPHWKIQTEEVVSVFGGVDDKRPILANPTQDTNRVLILKGTCIFGGIDIKSY